MKNTLVAYFSATGKTAKAADAIAKSLGADVYEIRPTVKYTKADLNWMDKKSRSSVEMGDVALRPEIVTGDVDISKYDTVCLGFPIWWYVAPRVINTFLESYDFTGKKIIVFATSGSSGFGDTVAELKKSAPESDFVQGEVWSGIITEKKVEKWLISIK